MTFCPLNSYGIYLFLFPFCIISASLADIRARSKLYEGDELVPVMPVFAGPQLVTSVLLGNIDKSTVKKNSGVKRTKFK